jgi:hypothetical protein
MKRVLLLLCSLSIAGAAELTPDRTVFILPMTHSLDQFIADQLTRMHVLQVVTDPAKADTIVTDRVGEPLETRLQELYPELKPKPAPKEPPKESANALPPREAANTAANTQDDQTPPDEATRQRSMLPPPIFGDTVNQVDRPGNMATTGHGRGTIFLVDVKSGQVLWSAFAPPKNSSPRELDHTAERIVKRLKDDMSPPKK